MCPSIPLSEAARAHELLEHGSYVGKVVLVTSNWSDIAARRRVHPRRVGTITSNELKAENSDK